MPDAIVLDGHNKAKASPGLTAEDFFGEYVVFSIDDSQYKITKVERDELGTKLYCGNFVFLYNKQTGDISQIK